MNCTSGKPSKWVSQVTRIVPLARRGDDDGIGGGETMRAAGLGRRERDLGVERHDVADLREGDDLIGLGIAPQVEETHCARSSLERHRIMVRQHDQERRAVRVLRAWRAIDGMVVHAAAMGQASDQRLALPIALGLRFVERLTLSPA